MLHSTISNLQSADNRRDLRSAFSLVINELV